MFWNRLLNLFGGRRVDRDIQREFDFHIAERAEQLHAEGMPLDEARQAARRHFGNALRIREDAHRENAIGWIEQMTQDVRLAARMLKRNPGFAIAAILTLAIGIGATTAVFSVVNSVLIRPLPYPDPDRLVGVWHSARSQTFTSRNVRLSSTMYLSYREHNRTFAKFGLWRSTAANVTGVGDPEQVRTIVVTHDTLPALGVLPAIGRWFSEADDTPGTNETAMLTYGYWQRRFGGDPAIIGRLVTIDARPHVVIGVMPRTFRFLNAEADVILPQRFEPAQLLPNDVHMYMAVARLKPGVSLAQANADIARILPLWIAERGTNTPVLTAAGFGPALRLVKDDIVGNVGELLWVLMGTISIVLLIACANVANLQLVRAEGRRQELTLRAALGARWRHVAHHLLAESVTLGVVGGALGLALAYAGLELLVSIGPASLPRLSEISIDSTVLAFTLAVSLLSALLFGLVPTVKYAIPARGLTLGSAGSRTIGDSRTRQRSQNVLLVVQVGLAVVLLVASGLMIRTFAALRSVQPGFVAAGVQTLRLSISPADVPEPERVIRMQQEILDRIAALPDVTSATFASALPMEAEFELSSAVTVEGEKAVDGIPPMRRTKYVSPGFFATLRTPFLAGRDFTWTEVHDRRAVAIVSRNMARQVWGGQPSAAIGKRIRIGRVGPWTEVVGVVEDVYDSGVDQSPPTTVYWRAGVYGGNGPLPVFIGREATFAIRSPRVGADDFLETVSQAVWAVNANLPLARVQPMDDIYRQSMARTSFTLVMLVIAGVLALTLGMVGIYGVISYAVSRRRREIGVRLALGAGRLGILRQFLGQGMRVSAFACLCGLALSLVVTRLLSSMLFGVSPIDATTLVGVVTVVLLVAALAATIPATRAAFIQPMRTLREE
jgi:predicted permease